MSKQRQDFINKYAKDVILSTKNTGLFPSVTMAQFIIESANSKGESGKGITVLKANNAFGIKADKNWKGAKMQFNTPKDGKPISYFRVYPTILDSLIDRNKFLKQNKRYTKSGVFDARTPFDQIDAIHRGKYSESPTYNQALKKIVSAYNLEKLDGIKIKQRPNNNGLLFLVLFATTIIILDNKKALKL